MVKCLTETRTAVGWLPWLPFSPGDREAWVGTTDSSCSPTFLRTDPAGILRPQVSYPDRGPADSRAGTGPLVFLTHLAVPRPPDLLLWGAGLPDTPEVTL